MIAEHVAAYAAGLYDAGGVLTWTQVSAAVAAAGMGSYSEEELANDAASYRRRHVAPGAIAFLNQLRRRQAVRK